MRPADATGEFGYSDGEAAEQYLEEVFNAASDLSSRSAELQSAIKDWPSEYHLSSDRANILRGFNLEGVQRVLELGSGCGAISRYLGEQGFIVDAVEGSAPRARLGKMRCRDLDNVRVINANYNDLEIPADHYDLILFIGVIEYASRFFPGAADDYSAAVSILKKSRVQLSSSGVIIIAIENRLGLKYVLGCHEDHYAKRYVGIDGYRNSAGIATYSVEEWQALLATSGLTHVAYNLAFPDYKIPRVLLGRDYAASDPHGFNHLEGLFARDYFRPVKRSLTESVGWQAASAGGFLPQVANSLCLVAGGNTQNVDGVSAFDFCHLPGPDRNNRYAVVTSKPRVENRVYKTPLGNNGASEKESGEIRQVLEPQEFLEGDLLSTIWLRSIMIHARREEFDSLVADFYSYLKSREESGEELSIDLLPINIVVGRDGGYQVFDQEWQVSWKITPEYLLFRALLTFIVTNWVFLRDFLGWLELHSIREFVDYGFRNHKLMLSSYIDEFVEMENRFQGETIRSGDGAGVEALLETRFDFSRDDRNLYAKVYWRTEQAGFDEERQVELNYVPDPAYQQLEFPISGGQDGLTAIRIDPFDIRKPDTVGYFSISRIRLLSDSQAIWEITGEDDIARACESESCRFDHLDENGFWLAETAFPKLVFPLPDAVRDVARGELLLQLDLRVAESREYILAHQKYLSRMRDIDQLDTDLKNTLRHLESARAELADIKEGKPFRFGMKVFSLLSTIKPGSGGAK